MNICLFSFFSIITISIINNIGIIIVFIHYNYTLPHKKRPVKKKICNNKTNCIVLS